MTTTEATAEARIRVNGSARAVGRFNPGGPIGYRAKSGGPLRATRAEAEADEQARFARNH